MAEAAKDNVTEAQGDGKGKGAATELTEAQQRVAVSAYDAMSQLTGQRSGSCLAHEGEPHARQEVLKLLNRAKEGGVANIVMETLGEDGKVINLKRDADGNVVRGNLQCKDGKGLIFRDKGETGWTIGHQASGFYGDKAAEVGMKFVNSVLRNPQQEKFEGQDSENTVKRPELNPEEKKLIASGLKSMLAGDQAGMQDFGKKLANQKDGGAKLVEAMDWSNINFGVGIDEKTGNIKLGNHYSGYMVVGKEGKASFEKGGSADGASDLADGVKSIKLETRVSVAQKLIATEGLVMEWSKEKGKLSPTRQQPIALGEQGNRFGDELIKASKEYFKSDEHKQFKEEMARRKAEEEELKRQKN